MAGNTLANILTCPVVIWLFMTGFAISFGGVIQRQCLPIPGDMTGAAITFIMIFFRPVFLMAGQTIR